MSYFVSVTYGPGYLEIFLDMISIILISDVVAVLLLWWMCWKPRKRNDQLVTEGYENVISTTESEKTKAEENFSEKATSVIKSEEAFEVKHGSAVDKEIIKLEVSTQTNEKKVSDKQTGTKVEPSTTSVSIQTIPQVQEPDIGKGDNSEKEDEEIVGKDHKDDVFRPILDRMKSREDITFVSGWRRTVKLTEIMKAKLILETRVEELERDEVTEAEIELELAPFLIGKYPIAGVIIGETGQKMSLDHAYKQGIITRGTAVSLLEAQAAVGSIIDPHDGHQMSVEDAKQRGLIETKMASIIARAELAVTGFKVRGTNEFISLFQAMKKNLVVETHGIRLLEAQIATGGIIDPKANMRLPVEVAFERGLFDERLHRILEDPSDDTKGFLDPNTQENLTYLELIQRCVVDEKTGHLLLPLVPETDRREYMERHSSTSTSSRSRTFSSQTFSSTSGSVGAIEDILETN